jgi:hypothetical protein
MDQQTIAVKQALKCLESIDIHERSITYNKLVSNAKHILFENCMHEIITDFIDINPDKSANITYCNHCELTFTIEYIYSYLQDCLMKVDKQDWKLSHENNTYKLLSFCIKNNKITFSIILKEGVRNFSFPLKMLINCYVVRDTIIFK